MGRTIRAVDYFGAALRNAVAAEGLSGETRRALQRFAGAMLARAMTMAIAEARERLPVAVE